MDDDVSFSVPKPLAILPWGEVPMRLRVRLRKFFYDDLVCKRKRFVERCGCCLSRSMGKER